MTKPKQRIELFIDYDDYEELKRSSKGIAGTIREALHDYLMKGEIEPSIDKLQKKVEAMQSLILELSERGQGQNSHIINTPPQSQKIRKVSKPLPLDANTIILQAGKEIEPI